MHIRILLLALVISLSSGSALAAEAPVVIERAAAPIHAIAKGKGQAKLFFNATNGSDKAALSILTIEYGAAVPLHNHPTSDELIYVISGVMDMTVAGKAYTVKAGDWLANNTQVLAIGQNSITMQHNTDSWTLL